MRSKDKTLIAAIEKFVSDYTDQTGISPTMQEVADTVGSSKATVQRYIAHMCDDGRLPPAAPFHRFPCTQGRVSGYAAHRLLLGADKL